MYGTRSLGASFGAEVLDFQLSGTTSEANITAVRELWAEHKLLLFRNQSLDEAALVGFSRQFGELEVHVREEYLSPEHPEILYVSNIEHDGRRIGIKKWLEQLPPYQGGGGMINEVKKDRISYGDLPNKYEAGTMATAQVIAFDQSIK